MQSKDVKWLPHLENSIPESIGGYSLSFYSVALEGWRRGLSLKFINENRKKTRTVFELSSYQRTHRFTGSRGDLVSRKGIRACIDKNRTKQYLEAANVPTPKGKEFTSKMADAELFKFANSIGYPIVLKPTSGHGGTGVVAGITNDEELNKALNYVRVELGFKKVIIEKFFEGEDYRVYVIGDKVAAVTKRVPANIIGDGESTISHLIEVKNQFRKSSPILASSLIKVDSELKEIINDKGYSLNSVPLKGEIVYLKSKNNISAGGDPSDITDELSDNLKKIAVNAVKSLPSTAQAGVDLLVNTVNNTAVVIEINSQPSIRTHLFPMQGEARDVPKEIIDFYFPETIEHSISSNLYFDFDPIWDLFKKGLAKEIVIPRAPSIETCLSRFVINRVSNYSKYGEFIRSLTTKLNLNGYMKGIGENKVAVVIAGEKGNIKAFNSYIKSYLNTEVKKKKRTTPVQIGFRII